MRQQSPLDKLIREEQLLYTQEIEACLQAAVLAKLCEKGRIMPGEELYREYYNDYDKSGRLWTFP